MQAFIFLITTISGEDNPDDAAMEHRQQLARLATKISIYFQV